MIVEVPSDSSSKTYSVDLEKSTCTCPAYTLGKSRPCKHIIRAFGQDVLPKLPLEKKGIGPRASHRDAVLDSPTSYDLNTGKGMDFYQSLERFSRTRLSKTFYMRDFLFSGHSSAAGVHSYPVDDVDQVLRSGKELCERLLEPILERFGRFIITYGYTNRLGMDGLLSRKEQLKVWSKSNPHHWDRGTFGKQVYARVDILPLCVEDGEVSKKEFGEWVMNNLDVCLLMQWRKSNVFCITISPRPRRVWLEWVPQGKGEGNSNRITFMGVEYWNSVWPSLPTDQRPKFGPSMSGGKMWW